MQPGYLKCGQIKITPQEYSTMLVGLTIGKRIDILGGTYMRKHYKKNSKR
jgi:hypothetical protein